MRIVDLSVPIENDIASNPPGYTPSIEYRALESVLVHTGAGERYGQPDYLSAGWTRAVALVSEG